MTGDERLSTAATADLIVDSATGVDVKLSVAGPGARAYGFVIDWHIRIILAFAWYVVAARLYYGDWSLTPPLEPGALWFGAVLAPPAGIYFLYHFMLEPAMRGCTPGKRMAGVRIATREGGIPSVGALLVRNVFRLIDSFPLLYSVGLFTTMLTRNHVRIGDLAAGTLLVYERAGTSLPAHPTAAGLDAASAEVLGELLHRWPVLAPQARRRLASALLARHAEAGDHPAASDARSSTGESDAQLRSRLERLASGQSA